MYCLILPGAPGSCGSVDWSETLAVGRLVESSIVTKILDVKVNGKFVDIDLPSLLLLEKKVAIEGVPQGFFLLMLLVDSVHTKSSNLVKLNYHSTACTWTVETGGIPFQH